MSTHATESERNLDLLEAFLQSLPDAERRVLLLDYDGTLAPFRVERDQAAPYPEIRDLLGYITHAAHTSVVVVTGRPLHEILPLLALDDPPEIWGSHGWERYRRGGEITTFPPPAHVEEALAVACNRVRDQCPGLEGRIENKPGSCAVHLRGLRSKRQQELSDHVRAAWAEVAELAFLELKDFDGGLELRATGRDKGAVVRTVLDEMGGRPAAAFLGDDLTDEDAFAAICGRGLGVLVRREFRPTLAQVWIRPPEELVSLLERWDRASAGSHTPPVG